jgi:hypothetical protein
LIRYRLSATNEFGKIHRNERREVEVRDPREGPKKNHHPFEHTYIDLRYLDAKPAGVQLYSCLLLEGLSRTILASSLTLEQEVGVVLHVYFQALLRWGLWEELVSDHGGQWFWRNFSREGRLSLFQLLPTRQALLPIPAGSWPSGW